MAIAVDHIIQIRDCQSLFGDQLCNIFYYVVKIWTGNATMRNILEAFEAQVITPVSGMQTASLLHNALRGDDLTDGITFFETDPNIAGSFAVGDTLPSLVALAMRLNRTTKITRPGQKRFAGLSEAVVEINKFITTTAELIAAQAAVASDLVVNAPFPDDGLLTPIIVGRDILGHLDLNRFVEVSSVSLVEPVSSQVSRKPGR